MKKLLVNLTISKCIFVVITFSNLVLPLYDGLIMHFNAFQIIAVLIWLYGLLSHLGYFKMQVSSGEDGVVRYEPKTPIVQIGVLRILEAGYFLFLKKDVVNWKVYILLVALDVIYIIFLLLDKSHYVFEMEADEDNDIF